MPHLRFRALDSKIVESLSESLAKPLADAMETSIENFTFECISTQFFSQGKSEASYPFVEVLWFERSQDIKIKSAKILTEQIKGLSKAADVVVVFTSLPKSDYFENGQSF